MDVHVNAGMKLAQTWHFASNLEAVESECCKRSSCSRAPLECGLRDDLPDLATGTAAPGELAQADPHRAS